MSRNSQLRHPSGHRARRETFSAWTMAIVFVAVAVVSFAVDQTVFLSPFAEQQTELQLPSLLHPIQLIETLIDAASE